jgi:hypothetical protein
MPKRHLLEPPQSVERRTGPRHGLVISGDPEMGPLARRTTGAAASAPAPVGALLPSFSGERKQTKGIRRPAKKPGGGALAEAAPRPPDQIEKRE